MLLSWKDAQPVLLYNFMLNLSYAMFHLKEVVNDFSSTWINMLCSQFEDVSSTTGYYLHILKKFGNKFRDLIIQNSKLLKILADSHTNIFFELFACSLKSIPSEINLRHLLSLDLPEKTIINILLILNQSDQITQFKNEIVQTNKGQEMLTLFLETKSKPLKVIELKDILFKPDVSCEDLNKCELTLLLKESNEFKNCFTEFIGLLRSENGFNDQVRMRKLEWLVNCYEKKDYVMFGVWLVGYMAMWKGRGPNDVVGNFLVTRLNMFMSKY
jgi:hypothetical protein